jgi:hypothetical protein
VKPDAAAITNQTIPAASPAEPNITNEPETLEVTQ